MQDWLGLPLNAAAHGDKIDVLLLLLHILMVVLFVGWGAFFLYLLFRFRRGRNPQADYHGVKSHASSYIEVAIAFCEVVLLVGLSIPFWSWKVSAFPTDPDTVRIRVIGQQFAWNMQYPGPDGIFGATKIELVNEESNPIGLDREGDPHAKDDIVTINQLHLPVDTPVILDLSTKDVIHGFSLPLLRVKQDMIPGMSIPIHFVATQTSDQLREQMVRPLTLPTEDSLMGLVAMADYQDADGKGILKKGQSVRSSTVEKLVTAGITEIQVGPRYAAEIACAQLCGLGHYRMKGFLTIHTAEEYAEWIEEELEYLE